MKYSEIRAIRKIGSYTFHEEYETNYSGRVMIMYRNGTILMELEEGISLVMDGKFVEISIY